MSVKSVFCLFKNIKTHLSAINIKSTLGNKHPRYLNSLFEKILVSWVLRFTIHLLAYNTVWQFCNKRSSDNIYEVQNCKNIKGSVMQIEKALINYIIHIMKISHSSYLWLCSLLPVKCAFFLKRSRHLAVSVYKQNLTVQKLKNKNSYEYENFSICYLYWSIIYLLLYNLRDCNFKKTKFHGYFIS